MSLLVAAVDIGTTNLKVGIFDGGGVRIVESEAPCLPEHDPGGAVFQSPEAWWAAFSTAFGECLAHCDGARPAALAVSSQAQTYLWLDSAGRPVGPARSWLDATGAVQVFSDALGLSDFYTHTGWPEPNPMLALCKLRVHPRPAAGVRLVFADGWLMQRLCGRCCVSRNLAAMSGLYSIPAGGWWRPALDWVGLPEACLPELVETGTAVGRLRIEAAREFGLGRIPVVAGANDQTAAALGAGLGAAGDTMLGLGTALVTYRLTREAASGARPPACRPLRGPYPGGGYYELLVCGNAGPLLEWARRLLPGRPDWPRFFETALAVPPGAAGLRCDPEPAPGQGARLEGITGGQGAAELGRAVLEGLAGVVRRQFDCLGVRGRPVRACGGGARVAGWVQMLADFSGREIERLDPPHVTLRGTALCALRALHGAFSGAGGGPAGFRHRPGAGRAAGGGRCGAN